VSRRKVPYCPRGARAAERAAAAARDLARILRTIGPEDGEVPVRQARWSIECALRYAARAMDDPAAGRRTARRRELLEAHAMLRVVEFAMIHTSYFLAIGGELAQVLEVAGRVLGGRTARRGAGVKPPHGQRAARSAPDSHRPAKPIPSEPSELLARTDNMPSTPGVPQRRRPH
jgi:hypothetical protein